MQWFQTIKKKWVIGVSAGILGLFSVLAPINASACGWWPGAWGCGWNNGGNGVALGVGLIAGVAIIGAIAASQHPVVYRNAPRHCYTMRRHGEYYRVCRTN